MKEPKRTKLVNYPPGHRFKVCDYPGCGNTSSHGYLKLADGTSASYCDGHRVEDKDESDDSVRGQVSAQRKTS